MERGGISFELPDTGTKRIEAENVLKVSAY